MDLIETLRELNQPDAWWTRATNLIRQNEYRATEHHYVGGNGAWSVKRKHKKYIESVLDTVTAPRECKAAVVGGMPGAGKSRMLPALFDPKEYFVVDPDDIKDWLIENGMAPEVEGLTPRETGPLLHVESTAIAKKLSTKLLEEHVNVIWPMTFTSLDAVRTRVNYAKNNGYTEVAGAFVLVSPSTSARRVKLRYAEGMNEYLSGVGLGGRFIDLERIPREEGTKAFKALSSYFSTQRVIDNDLDLI